MRSSNTPPARTGARSHWSYVCADRTAPGRRSASSSRSRSRCAATSATVRSSTPSVGSCRNTGHTARRERLAYVRELYARMAELGREGRPFAVATVVRTIGSTPQVVGAKMLVDDLGRTYGTLGGGCVEGDAFAEAKRVIDEGGSSLREYELTEDLAWDTGLVGGGTVSVPLDPGAGALPVRGPGLLSDVGAAAPPRP